MKFWKNKNSPELAFQEQLYDPENLSKKYSVWKKLWWIKIWIWDLIHRWAWEGFKGRNHLAPEASAEHSDFHIVSSRAIMKSSANSISVKTNSFLWNRTRKHHIWGLDNDELSSVYNPKSMIFQKISGFFRFIYFIVERNGGRYPQIWILSKRHRIWAFHIHPGRSSKFEQKILSLKKVMIDWKKKKLT